MPATTRNPVHAVIGATIFLSGIACSIEPGGPRGNDLTSDREGDCEPVAPPCPSGTAADDCPIEVLVFPAHRLLSLGHVGYVIGGEVWSLVPMKGYETGTGPTGKPTRAEFLAANRYRRVISFTLTLSKEEHAAFRRGVRSVPGFYNYYRSVCSRGFLEGINQVNGVREQKGLPRLPAFVTVPPMLPRDIGALLDDPDSYKPYVTTRIDMPAGRCTGGSDDGGFIGGDSGTDDGGSDGGENCGCADNEECISGQCAPACPSCATQCGCGDGWVDPIEVCDGAVGCGPGESCSASCTACVPDNTDGGTGDPCDGSGDPCCGSTDPCCGSDDSCCGDPDPCCGSGDPCCGSGDPCCGDPDPCCADPDLCLDTDGDVCICGIDPDCECETESDTDECIPCVDPDCPCDPCEDLGCC